MRTNRSARLASLALGLAALAALAGLAALPGGAALAQKKGGGGTPPPPAPGIIYFSGWVPTSGSDGYYAGMSMNGDGTNRKSVPYGFQWAPSYQAHGGVRWALLGNTDLDGPLDEYEVPPYELHAYSAQGQWVQLTTVASGVVWTGDGTAVAWGKDDSFVSFTAWEFSSGVGVRGGLYRVAVDWSTGTPAAGPPALVVEAEAAWYGGWNGGVNLYKHDWAPGGGAVACEREGDQGWELFAADFPEGVARVVPLGAAYAPAWSPDGGRLAFGRGGEVWTTNPDGSGGVRLTQKTVNSKGDERVQGSPSWSPDGAFIAYNDVLVSRTKTTPSLMRIPSGGGTPVNLAADLAKASGPRWRP